MSRSRWAPCGAKWRRALPVVEVRRGETQHGVRGVGGVHAAELLDGLQLLLARLYRQAELPRVQ